MAKPFDIEIYIGLPKELFYRAPPVAILENPDIEEIMKGYVGDPAIFQIVCDSFVEYKSLLAMNNPYVRELPMGSGNGHGTVAALAKFHGILANGGVYNGKRLLSEEAIRRQLQLKSYGKDVVYNMEYMYSFGTMLFPSADENKPAEFSFGHNGLGGQIALVDPTHKIGFAYGTNHLNLIETDTEGKDTRWQDLNAALYECVYKIKNISAKRKLFCFYDELKAHQDSLTS
ncbi:uncharacterized protein LOC117330536 [Pecten maximus]|uniref:uncharacterized protein LOC117330536 n=1 Tax=Pecten maximus TaxID=6579 RepID=UPI001457FFA4|nr:uncharacterized protein LOC117330536 [Pecten maximus]